MVLFFDEFQRLGEVVDDKAIEASIREVAQDPGNISFIFSGSNRHLLSQLFDDRNRPFYKLCRRLTLTRISQTDYVRHISQIAKLTERAIDEGDVKDICEYTGRHPYYMNLLCSKLWSQPKLNSGSIVHLWMEHAQQERSQVAAEIDKLTQNQRKLLVVLARVGGTDAPRGDQFIAASKMPGSTISQAMKVLLEKDYVHESEDGHFSVLDPLIEYVLSNA